MRGVHRRSHDPVRALNPDARRPRTGLQMTETRNVFIPGHPTPLPAVLPDSARSANITHKNTHGSYPHRNREILI